ncbi:MAG: DNRLRE domain-containing protein, partial [Acidobacteriota bacterium]
MRGSLVPFLVPVGVVCSALTLAAWAQAPQTVTLNPARDNTLYESDTGGLSNGQGVAIFAGRTGPNAGAALRRAVLTFDLSTIPPGAQITTAALQLQNSSSRDTGPQAVSVHRLTQDWGEGLSDASGPEGGGAAAATGDATWVHTFFDTSFWGSPGGDFAETASAQQTVGANGPYVWQSAGLLADVQAWVDGPSSNFGWIVIGEESTLGSAKRFNSREAGSGRPTLSVTFVPASQNRPGTVQFTQSVFEVDESDGSAVITVSRSGGTDGTVTLDFATADDSAVAGQDYTATAGTITFADGEGGTQNIQVPVLDDLIFEGVRIVQLTLSNPGGGAQLGEPSEAQLGISDNSDLSFLSYLPQFGNGGGFFSQILLLNAGVQRTATVRIVGHTDQGEPYLLGGGTPGTPILLDTLVEVAADGFALFDTGSNGDLQVGSVTLSSDAPVSAV